MTDNNNLENLQIISGVVEVITYKNEENGFFVCDIDSDGELITVVGHIPELFEGEMVIVQGEWKLHPSFGRQLKAHAIERRLPSEKASVLKYLASGALPGIGKILAQRIVEKFGDTSLEIIENKTHELLKIKGITKPKIEKIKSAFQQQFGIRSALIFLSQYDISHALSVKIIKTYGAFTESVMRENPYRLVADISRFTFQRADYIGTSLGFNHDNPSRLKAGIMHVIRHNCFENGHVFVPYEECVKVSCGFLGVEEDQITECIEKLSSDMLLRRRQIGKIDALYLNYFAAAEDYIAIRMQQMTKDAFDLEKCAKVDMLIEKIQLDFNIQYAPAQKKALQMAGYYQALIITGGPGTGKTTALKGLIAVFEKQKLSIVAAAPTGRASKRMSEVCGIESKTIHRLLEVEFQSGNDKLKFARNEENPLDADVVIIDEMSMVDLLLFESLLRALKPKTKLVLIGDADQLPPVGPGNVFLDMIASDKIPVVILTEIFRQAKGSAIVKNAHLINGGSMPSLENEGDFFFIKRQSASSTINAVVELCQTRIPKKFGFSPFSDIQVITPSKKGICGTRTLNANLQNALNPPNKVKKEWLYKDVTFRQSDKVMQLKNNYDLVYIKDNEEEGMGIFNGDIGVIIDILPPLEKMVIRFDDRIVHYPLDLLEDLDLAYAITVHKSQGNEWPAVIMPIFDNSAFLSYRSLLYTGVTRAKEVLVICGNDEKISQMVDTYKPMRRFTGLKELLLNIDIIN